MQEMPVGKGDLVLLCSPTPRPASPTHPEPRLHLCLCCDNLPSALALFFHPHILHEFDMFLCLPVSAAAPEGMLERRRRRGVCPRACPWTVRGPFQGRWGRVPRCRWDSQLAGPVLGQAGDCGELAHDRDLEMAKRQTKPPKNPARPGVCPERRGQ